MKPLFSIIIPVRHETRYLRETKKHLVNQTLKSFELIIVTDEFSLKHSRSILHLGPSYKRNLGAKFAKGKYLAFLDDDSYPSNDWLKNAYQILSTHTQTSAVCGPCLIPSKDNIFQKASGLFWSSFMGSGGAGVYRNSIQPQRFVDDYPSVNLIITKKDFTNAGGFDNRYWPGEDTLLCLQLTHLLKKKITYHPSIVVYHHRRNIIIPHLQQITRYAISRGFFAKKFPQTSLRIGYLLPSFFFLYLLSLPFIFHISLYRLPLYFYLFGLLLSLFDFLLKTKNLTLSLLATITIPITHIYYGILFIIGLAKNSLKFQPHKINKNTGKYVGG